MRRTFALLLVVVSLGAGEGPDIAFLDAAAAAQAIVDESAEPYFALLQDAEMAAKTGSPVPGADLAARRDECRRRYADAARDFAPAEQAGLRALVQGLHPAIARVFPLLAATPWRFLKVDDRIEGGLPHTRGGCIVVSVGLARQLGRIGVAAPADERALARVRELLVHEQVHVLQRRHGAAFAALYADVLGFRRMQKAPEPEATLRARHLVNPDGVDVAWAFPVGEGAARRWIQPLVVLARTEGVPRMPQDFAMVALAVEERDGAWRHVLVADGTPQEQPLHAVPGYAERFAPAGSIYHPNEIVADLIPLLVLRELGGAEEPATAQQLRAWCAAQAPREAP